jgi:XTP/dITP diphosphohydrolase
VRVLLASTNPGKLRELRRLVEGTAVEVVSPADLAAPLPEVEEDGATMAENAAKKASAWARASGLHTLADDSGLCVDALHGLPGVRSARWSEQAEPGLSGRARDEANNRQLGRALEGVPEGVRGAEYRAVLALAGPGGEILATVTGTCRGQVALAPRGEGGFGYDPWLVPDGGGGRTMAELPAAEKDALSHRGEAFRRMLPHLAALGG